MLVASSSAVAPRLGENKVLYGLVVGFGVIAVVFVASAIWTIVALHRIGRAGHDLLGNSLPSVTELMNTRTALHEMDIDVADMERTRSSRHQLVEKATRARSAMTSPLSRAMATPDYPGERELYDRGVRPRMTHVDHAIDGLQKAVADDPANTQRVSGAVAALDAAANELDGQLGALAELNHAHAFDAASNIVHMRQQLLHKAMYLEIASAFLAIIAAMVAVRGERRYARQARRALELETDRARELDLVAQRVAHDLVSPLSGVAISLGAIQRRHPDPGTSRVVERARRALERSRQMVQCIYAFSGSGARPAPGAAAPVRAMVQDAADALVETEPESPPTIVVEPFDEVHVAMESAVLGVIVSNLLSNASKYSRDGPTCRVVVRSRADDTRVHVEVEDTGPGVPHGMEQTILEPFKRAPGVVQPGLGLGLATVKRLVHAHRGKVGVSRAPSGGAIFWFDLPRAAGAPAAGPEQRLQEQDGEGYAAH